MENEVTYYFQLLLNIYLYIWMGGRQSQRQKQRETENNTENILINLDFEGIRILNFFIQHLSSFQIFSSTHFISGNMYTVLGHF